jgi:ATP-dependent DNA ligase
VNHARSPPPTATAGRYPWTVVDTPAQPNPRSRERASSRRWWPAGVMLAKPVEGLPPANALPGGCLYEPKWDGYRALVRVDDDGTRIRSRRGTDLTPGFPDIAEALAMQLHPGTVMDGELVIWNTDTGSLDFAALQHRLTSPRRAVMMARRRPASFVAFDLLVDAGTPLAGRPLRERRRALERLIPLLEPPLQVTPATRRRDIAATWLRDYATADVGVEGLVIKGLAQPYRPDTRAWLKVKSRSTEEAIVGAVTGTIARPERLILGLPDSSGTLVIVGGTGPLRPGQQRELASLLRFPAAPHPWPAELPAGRTGVLGGRRRLPVVLVEPELVVEVAADAAREYGRWRHLTRLVRIRAELHPEDLSARPGNAWTRPT